MSPSASEATEPIEHAVIVFGAAVTADGRPSPALRERLRVAMGLARADRHAMVVVSGGAVHGLPPEAPVMARWLAEQGLARQRIVLEPHARSTIENAELTAPIVRRLGARRVTVVTQRYHAPRALLHLRSALRHRGGEQVAVALAPAEDPRGGGLQDTLAIAVEAIKLVNDLTLRRWHRWLVGRRRS